LAAGRAAAFGAVFAAVFEAGAFETGVLEADVLEPVAFATVFAVFFGIELLLFLEDFAAEAALPAEREFRPRPFDVPRPAEAVFRDAFKVLVLRVFCDTACARNCHAPVRCIVTGTQRGQSGLTGFG
jgi:hypothetical protein